MVDRVKIFEGRCKKLYFELKRVRRILREEVQGGGLDGFGNNSWDQVQFLVGQSIWSCERADYARCRYTCGAPAVKLRDKKNKEGK